MCLIGKKMKMGEVDKSNPTNLIDIAKRWCQVTTCAGIIDLYMAKGIIGKIFWSLFIALCFGFTLMQTVDVFRMFLNEYPYQSQMDVISEDQIPFPNLTICNFNRIDETLIGDVDREVFSYVFATIGINYNIEKKYEHLTQIYEPRWNEMQMLLNVTNLKSLYAKYGHTCEDTFILCKWQLQEFDCCKHATETLLSYGRCWSILPNVKNNPDKFVYQSFPGVYYGLQLIINPKLKSYLKKVVSNNMLEQGIIVMAGYTEQTDIFDYNVVQAGMHSWLSLDGRLETVKSYRMPFFPQLCRKNTTLKFLSCAYSKENCESECWAELQYSQCNCTNLVAAMNEPYEMCPIWKYFSCIYDMTKNASLIDEMLAKCRKGCLNSCNPVWSVKMSQSSAKFIGNSTDLASNKFWHDLLQNLTDNEQVLNSLIAVNFYFSSLKYMKIEIGEAYPILNFIGDIGGQLSLFLGISIVTIVQLIWYFCIYLFPRCCQVKSVRNPD